MAFEAMPAAPGTLTLRTGTLTSTQSTIGLGPAGFAGAFLLGAARSPIGGAIEVACGDEVMIVRKVEDDIVWLDRGQRGSVAAAHANAAPVYVLNSPNLYATVKAGVLAAAPGS